MRKRSTGSALATGLLVVALALSMLLTGVVVAPTSAETIADYASHLCGRQAVALERQARAAAAVGDDRQSDALDKQAAKLWYECAQRIRDPYGHDLALLFYGGDLLGSTYGTADELRIDPIVASAMNDLAYATRYDDIRRMALATKQSALADDNMACRENEQAFNEKLEAAGAQPVPDSCPSVPPWPSPSP